MDDNDELDVTMHLQENITFQQILDTDNIATLLSDRDLCMIGELCLKEKEDDEDSLQDWKTTNEQAMDIINPQNEVQKTVPWLGAADVKFPLLSQAIVNASSRMLPALIKNDEPVKPRIFGIDADGAKAKMSENVKKFMTWQLVGDPKSKWKRDFDKSLVQLFLSGTIFRKCCYDEVTGKKYFEMIPYKDLIVNKNTQSLDKALRISQNHIFRQNDIETRIRSGKWLRYDYQSSDGENDYDDSGTSGDADTYNKIYTYTEQHRWLDLDNDGYAEPYIVYIDNAQKMVVCINRNFDVTDEDLDQETGEVLKLEPNQYYIAYHLIPSFDGGFYSYGFAYLFLHINSICNSIINMMLDASSLICLGGGFIGRGARLRAGTIRSAQNEWHPVDNTPGSSLKDNIVPFQNPGPPQVLLELLNILIGSGKELAGMTEVLSGEMPARELPAQTMMAIVDEATKPFSAIHGRIYDSLKDELEMLFMSNSKDLDNDLYQQVLGDPQANYQQDFNGKLINIIPGADPNASSKAQEQTRLAVLATIPGTDQHEVSLETVKSLGFENPERFVPPPNPNPPPSLEQLTYELNRDVAMKQLEQRDRELDQKDRELLVKEKEMVLDAERVSQNWEKIKGQAIFDEANAEALNTKTTLGEMDARLDMAHRIERHELDKVLDVIGAEHDRADAISRRMASASRDQTGNGSAE